MLNEWIGQHSKIQPLAFYSSASTISPWRSHSLSWFQQSVSWGSSPYPNFSHTSPTTYLIFLLEYKMLKFILLINIDWLFSGKALYLYQVMWGYRDRYFMRACSKHGLSTSEVSDPENSTEEDSSYPTEHRVLERNRPSRFQHELLCFCFCFCCCCCLHVWGWLLT